MHRFMLTGVKVVLLLAPLVISGVVPTSAADEIAKVADKPIPVIVGGYIYEPFVVNSSLGVSLEIVRALNLYQNTYAFTFSNFPARRRYHQIETGQVDVIMFESPEWGWSQHTDLFETTRPFVRVCEILVANSDSASGVGIFKELEKRRIVVVNGYHYDFADFVSDAAALKERFNITLVDSLDQVMTLVENKRAEVGVVNDVFLAKAFEADPARKQNFIEAPMPDRVYLLPMLVSHSSPLGAKELEKMIDEMMTSGRLDNILPESNIIHSGD